MRFPSILFLVLSLFPSLVAAQSFPDVPTNHNNLRAIVTLQSSGVINGYPDGTFRPDRTINRAEMLKILVMSIGSDAPPLEAVSCFPDVQATDWYSPYVCLAAAQGWVSGYPDGYFRPDYPVNLAEAMKMLVTVRQYDLAQNRAPVLDLPRGEWFTPYMDTLLAKDVISPETLWGVDKDDGLDKPLMRMRASELLYRAMLDDGRVELQFSGDCDGNDIAFVRLEQYDTKTLSNNTVLIDVAITGEAEDGTACTLARSANPYGQASKYWNSMRIFAVASPEFSDILERAPVLDGKIYLRKGHETAGLGDDLWVLDIANHSLSLLANLP